MGDYIQKSAHFLQASIKDMDMKQGIITGYAASFNTLDADNDIILPGAFQKTISDQGPKSVQPRIKHLLNHNTDWPVGVPMLLSEDQKGLYYESKAGTNDIAVDVLKMIDSGLITEHSIGYRTIRKNVMNPEADWENQKTQLQELKLYEFSSLTGWGANQYTPLIGVKSKQNIEERIDRLIKACANGTFTDTTARFLEDELLFLQKAFKDISTHAVVKTPEPDTLQAIIKQSFKQVFVTQN